MPSMDKAILRKSVGKKWTLEKDPNPIKQDQTKARPVNPEKQDQTSERPKSYDKDEAPVSNVKTHFRAKRGPLKSRFDGYKIEDLSVKDTDDYDKDRARIKEQFGYEMPITEWFRFIKSGKDIEQFVPRGAAKDVVAPPPRGKGLGIEFDVREPNASPSESPDSRGILNDMPDKEALMSRRGRGFDIAPILKKASKTAGDEVSSQVENYADSFGENSDFEPSEMGASGHVAEMTIESIRQALKAEGILIPDIDRVLKSELLKQKDQFNKRVLPSPGAEETIVQEAGDNAIKSMGKLGPKSLYPRKRSPNGDDQSGAVDTSDAGEARPNELADNDSDKMAQERGLAPGGDDDGMTQMGESLSEGLGEGRGNLRSGAKAFWNRMKSPLR